jgi:short-subunit dehydrogenase
MAADHPVILVTGAAGNLGRAVLAELDASGAGIVAVDREVAWVEPAVVGLPGAARHMARAADLGDAAACAALVADVIARYGRIDGLAHTVGGFAASGIDTSDAALFEGMFRLNVLTTVNIVRAVVPPMRAAGRGSIVTIGAGAALKAPAGLAAYAAAKAGVLKIVESVADELKPTGVRINAVLPSIIDTPQNRAAMPDADYTAWVAPATLAATIGFLLGEGGSAITGVSLPVSGRV